MGVFRWPIGRAGRGQLWLWVLAGIIGLPALDWFLLRRTASSLEVGFHLSIIRYAQSMPIWRIALELLYEIGITVLAIARLHDIGKSGWWLAGIAALSLGAGLLGMAGLSMIGLLLMLGTWLALLLWPGDVGPNAFGADPAGWESREHFDRQMRELKEQAKPRS